MKSSLAGYNVLLIVEQQSAAIAVLSQGFSDAGANVFTADGVAGAKELQGRCDFDLVLAAASFLEGVGEDLVLDRGPGKTAPLLFAFGSVGPARQKLFKARGVLKIFPPGASATAMAKDILPYLFDPKEHFLRLSRADEARQITLLWQDGAGQSGLEVHLMHFDGLTARPDRVPEGETGVLTVSFPREDGQETHRFAMRAEVQGDVFRFRVIYKERERWQGFLRALEDRQKEITEFLLASSGR